MAEEPLPNTEEVLQDMEELEVGLPFADYAKDRKRLGDIISGLEKQYKKREKIIDRIMAYGTGVESENALRMFPTSTLEKWEQALEEFRASKLKKK